MAFHFAALDNAEELSSLFAGPTWLTREERLSVEREEGRTLGVLSSRQVQPRVASPSLRYRARLLAGSPNRRAVIAISRRVIASPARLRLPECDFVYFATPACGSWTITAEFVGFRKSDNRTRLQ